MAWSYLWQPAATSHAPFYQCGTKNCTRYLDITRIQQALRGSACDALVGMHAFTGCDSISVKLTALTLLKSDKAHQEIFSQLGQAWDVPSELFEGLQQITCQTYFPSSHTKEVNKLRFELLCAKRGEVESSQLPPCDD